MTTINSLERGKEAFRRQAWREAYELLSSADEKTPLDAEDLELLAKAAYLIGKETECLDIWTRAHHEFLEQGKPRKAAHGAFWVGMILLFQGERSQGSGWLARSRRIVDDHGQDCVELGFLCVPEALRHLREGDAEGAYELFNRAGEIGRRFNSHDLMTFSRLGRGQTLIYQNKISEGTTLLDEAMVAVISDEISPIVAGIVYCAVLEACQKIYDLRRAQEWTAALSHWCDSQPDLVPYRGQCLVRRAEIMQLHGEWPDAMNEVQRVCELPRASNPPATGEAFYRQAELYRLQGEFSKAEEMYNQANKFGRKPQPGLALLRMAQGQLDVAEAAIRRLEEEKQDRVSRSRILPAFIEIMVVINDIPKAEKSAAELSEIAVELRAPFLQAVADHAQGNVLLANGEPRAALNKLLHAWSLLKKIEALYESAQTRVLIGLAYRELGDKDTSDMELDAARWIFQQLGAAHDLAKVDSIIKNAPPDNSHGLTPRELEVLCQLATGKTNKEIATGMFISERTVDRHVSNILAKLDVPSRAAATAYAYKHNLLA